MIAPYYSYLTIAAFITVGCGTYVYYWMHHPASTPSFEQLHCTIINENQLIPSNHLILFAHGIDADEKAYLNQAKSYADALESPALTFSFNDAFNRINLAQKSDLDCLERAYHYTTEKYPDKKIILIGVSRGASTIIKFLAERKRSNIKCVILESPWDTIQHLTEHISNQYLMYVPLSTSILNRLAHSLPNVQRNQIEVIDAINQLHIDTPFHVIYSTADKVIPPHGTANVIKILQLNNQTVSSICLSNGKHGKLSHSDECKQSIKAFIRHLN